MTTARSMARPRPQYSTLCSVVLHGIAQGFLLTIVAIIFFMLAFGITVWKENKSVALDHLTDCIQMTHDELAAVNPVWAETVHTVMDENKKKMMDWMREKHHRFYSLFDGMGAARMRGYQANFCDGIEIGGDAIELLCDRFCLLFLSLPLWMGCGFVMVVDGIGQHDIRKCQAARESAFYFHRLIALARQWLQAGFLLYLSLPIFCQTDRFLLGWMMGVSLCVMQAIKYYKKQM